MLRPCWRWREPSPVLQPGALCASWHSPPKSLRGSGRPKGSLVYAKECRARHDRIVAMLSLESVGFYSDTPRSQTYPVGLGLLYPATGNFVAFIGNVTSRPLVHRAIAAFRATNALPTIGAAARKSTRLNSSHLGISYAA